jgi:uncharacterized protein YndB with AHSA1/START domain
MSMMMSVLVLGGAVALVATLVIAFLPSKRVVQRTAVVKAPPADVFAVLSSSAGFQRFNPYRDEDPNLKIRLTGPESGIGSGFSFEGKGGQGTQTITALTPDRSVTMHLDLGPMGQPTTTFTLADHPEGTAVSWRTEAVLGRNPVARVIGVFLDRMMGPTYERGLANLDRVLSRT